MGGARGRLVTADDRLRAIELVNEACLGGARKHKACELLEISVRTLIRWQKPGTIDKRKGSERLVANKLTHEERQQVLATVNSSEYRDLPPCQIVPHLADKGIYMASESTIYRILRENKQLAHRGLTKPAKHKRPPPHIATGPNQLWSWDITFLPSQVRGIYFYLYLMMDVYSRKIVGWTIQFEQTAVLAADLIQQACIDEGIARNQIVLHADNGSPMKGATMLAMLETLGVVPSFSRPSVSDDNPFSEALFKTLKYRPNFPLTDKFATVFDARAWVVKFTQWYNNDHRHSGLKFITPAQRHSGMDTRIMDNRHDVYLRAKKQFPARWAGNTRNWQLPVAITLNANKKANQKKNRKELKAAG